MCSRTAQRSSNRLPATVASRFGSDGPRFDKGQDTGQRMASDINSAMDDAGRALDNAGESARDTAQDVGEATRDLGREAGEAWDQAQQDARNAIDEQGGGETRNLGTD